MLLEPALVPRRGTRLRGGSRRSPSADPSGCGPGEALGDRQPLGRALAGRLQGGVVDVAPLGDDEAEVERVALDASGGAIGPRIPGVPVGAASARPALEPWAAGRPRLRNEKPRVRTPRSAMCRSRPWGGSTARASATSWPCANVSISRAVANDVALIGPVIHAMRSPRLSARTAATARPASRHQERRSRAGARGPVPHRSSSTAPRSLDQRRSRWVTNASGSVAASVGQDPPPSARCRPGRRTAHPADGVGAVPGPGVSEASSGASAPCPRGRRRRARARRRSSRSFDALEPSLTSGRCPHEVLYDVDAHVATITLNRPDRLNAATFELGEQLRRRSGGRRARRTCGP